MTESNDEEQTESEDTEGHMRAYGDQPGFTGGANDPTAPKSQGDEQDEDDTEGHMRAYGDQPGFSGALDDDPKMRS